MNVKLSFGCKAFISRDYKEFLRILWVIKGFAVISRYMNGFILVSRNFDGFQGTLKEFKGISRDSKGF